MPAWMKPYVIPQVNCFNFVLMNETVVPPGEGRVESLEGVYSEVIDLSYNLLCEIIFLL